VKESDKVRWVAVITLFVMAIILLPDRSIDGYTAPQWAEFADSALCILIAILVKP
jgi:hypothetical protein